MSTSPLPLPLLRPQVFAHLIGAMLLVGSAAPAQIVRQEVFGVQDTEQYGFAGANVGDINGDGSTTSSSGRVATTGGMARCSTVGSRSSTEPRGC